MELKDITLDVLLNNENIQHVKWKNKWFFSFVDMNKIYNNGFEFTPSVVLSIPFGKQKKSITFISFTNIQEQVEHKKNKPNFGELIDKALGLKIKKN